MYYDDTPKQLLRCQYSTAWNFNLSILLLVATYHAMSGWRLRKHYTPSVWTSLTACQS